MRELIAFPPNYQELNERFHVRGKPVIFSWGGIVYNPSKIKIPPQLRAHEIAHGERQLKYGIQAWWDQYMIDADFRLGEEIIGHRAEWQSVVSLGWSQNNLEKYITAISARLSGSLYGNMISAADAEKAITQGAAA